MNKRSTIKIARIIDEAEDIKSFVFAHDLTAKPGQFIMLTDFEGGEKPFSIADCTSNEFMITVKRIGEFTTRLFQKQVGDYVSVRGPFGSSFFVSDGNVLLVGGGYGTPPLYFLAKELLQNGAKVTVVNGAKSKEDLVFCNKFRELGVEYQNITQLGCLGREGTSVDLAEKAMEKQKFDHVYAAGPEMMMKALQPLLKDLEYEFLFERYMKCAIGICGNCTIDPIGIRLCVEGPVLPKKLVEQLTEFGKYHRDATGKRIEF
ncbi:MAG: dihydroorotate dehydrogenase electron transfer subunit [Candidatus Cloacimonetes bacterium]|nr:dihydroorotate dehydrogenase electron transfer subunit [Candidatus Cloacimonadota bacterium]MCF7812890.1 dihydroorotate dehydrogenase electron transfer subunit [Candidatus Cloacimonadota bacterium]MCF7867102.1 dihydroorotate dehydrogenase electron transfer subunit [Candidatus Cloacimonadota bacterium]MCF7882578.1 dihydroorotate dehydrogenase electron transfer subunit [Candidatus Cloacimonadota bacterium]